ncbi:hypothetical protein KL938_000362 [Ogataea parapolymorpha]|nr:hypothetical protein KL938_000362 [Ogataea parapolymorpha]
MSDSIDRVFVKAIATIRTLSTRSPKSSLPRPPLANRVKLYGLYKQATEGDVTGLMERPIGSRPEDEAAKRKWDAWKLEEGLSKTDAKKQYISYLIETMRSHANESVEARELLSELEYLWDQVKDQQVSPTLGEFHHEVPLSTRAQSPALSLYRLTSSGSHANLVRPVSRLSMTSVPAEKQSAQGVGARAVSSTATISQIAGSGATTGGLNSQGVDTTKNLDFVRWQNDINATLTRLSYEISSLKTIGLNAQLHESPPTRNVPRKDRRRRTLYSRIRALVVSLLSKMFRVFKTVLKHAALDLVVALVFLGFLHKISTLQGWDADLGQALGSNAEAILHGVREFYNRVFNGKWTIWGGEHQQNALISV